MKPQKGEKQAEKTSTIKVGKGKWPRFRKFLLILILFIN